MPVAVPAMHELVGEYRRKVIFIKVDVDIEAELVDLFEVRNTPRVYWVREGEILIFADERLTKSELCEGLKIYSAFLEEQEANYRNHHT